MKAVFYFAAALLVAVSILLSTVNDKRKESAAIVTQEQLSGQFLNYVEAFNTLWQSGAVADGDVSNRITLPAWLPHNSNIGTRVSGGVGYVFTPLSPGLLSQLLEETGNTAHIGLSDAAGINTPAGRLNRPAFIPAGYVVYVR